MTTALVDLSNACRGDSTTPSWDRYVLLRQRLIDEGFASVRAIGDSSLRYRLLPLDVSHLDASIGRKEVKLVPYADPHLIRTAFANDKVTIVSNDRFRGLRRQFPGLDGFERVLAFRFSEHDVHLYHSPLDALSALEASRMAEEEKLRPLGYARPEHRELLSWDWRCLDPACEVAQLPQLDELPACHDGTAVCPVCGTTLERLGLAAGGLEIKILVASDVYERFALAAGTSRIVGRGTGPGRFDVTPLLSEKAAALVSRSHVKVENQNGRLRVHDLGSTNGTDVLRSDGSVSPLNQSKVVVVSLEDRVSLAGVLEIQPSGRRWPRASFVDTTATPPPSQTQGRSAT